MKAIVYTNYGPPEVLHLAEVEKPLPGDNEVLIQVHATSVNFGDRMARDFKAISSSQFNMPLIFWLIAKVSFGLNRPRITILGNEFAGEVVAHGKNVKRFKPGDQVFGYTGERMGAYAEYLSIPESGILAIKPVNLSYQEAAALPYGAIMALSLIGRANLRPGARVLINGASGGIGSAAVQITRSMGTEVTGVCSTAKMDFVKSLGAAKVIDYTKEDFTQNGETYDLIFDILGKSSFSHCKASLTPNGIHLFASFKMRQLFQMLLSSISGGKKVICALGPGSVETLNLIKTLIEAGKIKPFIDRTFPLEQATEAHAYVEEGHKKGNVVLTIDSTALDSSLTSTGRHGLIEGENHGS